MSKLNVDKRHVVWSQSKHKSYTITEYKSIYFISELWFYGNAIIAIHNYIVDEDDISIKKILSNGDYESVEEFINLNKTSYELEV